MWVDLLKTSSLTLTSSRVPLSIRAPLSVPLCFCASVPPCGSYPDDPDARDRKARMFALSMASTMAKLLDLTLPIVAYFTGTQFNLSVK